MRLVITILIAATAGFALVGIVTTALQLTAPSRQEERTRPSRPYLPVEEAIRVVLERSHDIRRAS